MRRMSEARALMSESYAYAWRHELRLLYLEARIALAQGHVQAAVEHASRLVADAVHRSAPRYARLGEVMTLRARAALGAAPPTENTLRSLSEALSLVAGVEAWWLLAELGQSSGVALCFDLAAEQRERLGGSLEPAARARFGAYAHARLDMIRTRGRTG
jgi:hypothetical protein